MACRGADVPGRGGGRRRAAGPAGSDSWAARRHCWAALAAALPRLGSLGSPDRCWPGLARHPLGSGAGWDSTQSQRSARLGRSSAPRRGCSARQASAAATRVSAPPRGFGSQLAPWRRIAANAQRKASGIVCRLQCERHRSSALGMRARGHCSVGGVSSVRGCTTPWHCRVG